MSVRSTGTLQVRGLGRQKIAAIAERAKRLGMTPLQYLKHLVNQDLTISERAKTTSFEELLGSGQPVNEAELDVLVEQARNDYHRNKRRKA